MNESRDITIVSIPQAVSTIAIEYRTAYWAWKEGFNTASGKYYCNLTCTKQHVKLVSYSFNTASGKYYCNFSKSELLDGLAWCVSIPQAVSTIAILCVFPLWIKISLSSFNTASGKYYCNSTVVHCLTTVR